MLSDTHLIILDVRLLEYLRGVLIKKRQVQHSHRIFHKSASAFVVGIGCQSVRHQKLHRIRVMVYINECTVGQTERIHPLQIDR